MKQSTHAKENGKVRRGRNQNRERQIISLRHLHGGHEAQAEGKAKRQIIPSGIFEKVAEPALQIQRDDLLNQLFETQRQHDIWITQLHRYAGVKRNSATQRKQINAIFLANIKSIQERLVSLDERISPIMVQNGR